MYYVTAITVAAAAGLLASVAVRIGQRLRSARADNSGKH